MSRSRGARSLTTWLPMRISPSVTSSSPATMRSEVVFPQPDGPTRTTNSASPTSRSSSLTAQVPSRKIFVTRSNVTLATRPPLRVIFRALARRRDGLPDHELGREQVLLRLGAAIPFPLRGQPIENDLRRQRPDLARRLAHGRQ